MESWQSDDGDGDVIEIVSADEYDSHKAKAQASLSWILHKAYPGTVPKEFADPFYVTGEGSWQIKPRLANLLASSEVYCQACKYMFGENASQWTGHWSIIQVLSRKGIYAVGSDSLDVTETILMQSAPFKLKAHLALIDALMSACSCEVASVERVTQAVRRFATFSASSELPADTEAALLFWVNKACNVVQQKLEAEHNSKNVIEGGQTNTKVRIVSSGSTPRESISVPVIQDLVEDMGDGCSLATLISFYCPTILALQDVCLKSNVGIADSLYNLRIIRNFCDRHLPHKTWHLSYEDVLYTHETLRHNLVMLLAELFYWFEVRTLPVATGAGLPSGTQEHAGARPEGSVPSRVPKMPAISSVTKQSFQCMSGERRGSGSPDRPSQSAPPAHRTHLLHKRHADEHASRDDHGVQRIKLPDTQPGVPRHSTQAWPDNQVVREAGHSAGGSTLLANVSIDSDVNASFSSTSIDLGDLDASPRSVTDSTEVTSFSLHNKKGTPFPGAQVTDSGSQPDQSVQLDSAREPSDDHSLPPTDRTIEVARSARTETASPNLEPLMPARLKPSKEKANTHTKEEERDEGRRAPATVHKRVMIDPHLAVINRSGDVGDSSLDISQMSDAHGINASHQRLDLRQDVRDSDINFAEPEQNSKKFEAFFVRGSLSESEGVLTHRSDATVAESYVIDGQTVQTPEAARAAGIPVIDDFGTTPRRLSREGSVASSKSSGDFSDHESLKIHADHKTQETVNKLNMFTDTRNQINDFSDPARFIIQKPVIMSRTQKPVPVDPVSKPQATTFSQIKQMKQFGNMDNSGLIYMQQGKEEPVGRPTSLKDAFQKKQQVKQTGVAVKPGQTTWQNSQDSPAQGTTATGSDPAENGAVSQELLKIKMKLEEKRKAIERKKHTQEIQQQKMRQRLGKAAFLHVVAKPKDDQSSQSSSESGNDVPVRMITSDPELPLGPGTPESRMTSSSPMRSPSHRSRSDIQQTIENVRKNWFNENDLVAPMTAERSGSPEEGGGKSAGSEPDGQFCPRPVFDRRSASMERISSLAEHSPTQSRERSPQPVNGVRGVSAADRGHMTDTPPSMQHEPAIQDRRSASVERTSRPDTRQNAPANRERSESYDTYNNSLDKLNQSLTDLQGEIMKLSLKKGQRKSVDSQRSRSKSPPRVLDVREKSTPAEHRSGDQQLDPRSQSVHSQARSASEPRQRGADSVGLESQGGNYQTDTLGQPMGFQQPPQMPSYMMQPTGTIAGPTGPVYGTPSHYVPAPGQRDVPPTAQQYGSYIMGPSPAHPIPGYQASPPHGYPTPPGGYPGSQPFHTQPLVSPQTQPFSNVYGTPPGAHFSPVSQYNPAQPLMSTYTTSSQLPAYTAPSLQHPFPPAGQQHQSPVFVAQQQQVPFSPAAVPSNTNQPVSVQDTTALHMAAHTNVQPTVSNTSNVSHIKQEHSVNKDISEQESYFVSTNEGSPRTLKAKPQLSSKNVKVKPSSPNKNDLSQSQEKYGSSVIADFAREYDSHQAPVPSGGQMQRGQGEPDTKVAPTGSGPVGKDASGDHDASSAQDTSAVGFVIGQDETSLDQSAEEEMARRKEKLERMRQKRQEEAERKRQKLERESNQRKQQDKLKQEETERRRSEEKARREAIFQQYLEKKEEDEDGGPPRRTKPQRPKPRPKSMLTKTATPADPTEGYSSTEDLSARNAAFTIPPDTTPTNNGMASKGPKPRNTLAPPSKKQSMRKAVSMNTLHNGDGKNLAYGGLTHRRPPSPDLYRPKRGQRSNESSETGSAHGSDYSGPKLFVKPSAKSNRHIITNAISHCCLAGCVNTDQKNKVLEEIAKSSAKHFIILFRDSSCGYRGLYGFDPETEDCFKIVGVGPRSIHHDMVEKYYKYNSGGKSFSEVSSTKHISVSIDAISLQNTVWKPAKPPAKAMR